MVRKSTAEALGRNAATAIEIVGPSGEVTEGTKGGCGGETGCGSAKLEW
jgi:nitrite reductase (NAD(P)H)